MTCLNLFAYIFVYIKLENKFPKMNNLALMISSYVVVIHDRKSTRLNSSHSQISYAVFCLKKKKQNTPFLPSLSRLVARPPTFIVSYHTPVLHCIPRLHLSHRLAMLTAQPLVRRPIILTHT